MGQLFWIGKQDAINIEIVLINNVFKVLAYWCFANYMDSIQEHFMDDGILIKLSEWPAQYVLLIVHLI